MAKRVRGSTARPGQRRPIQRSATRSTASSAPATPATPAAPTAPLPPTLTDEEEARAAQLEAAIVAEERRAEDTERPARSPRRETGAPRETSSIAISAAEEYAYVARDVKRISLVGGSLVLVLLGLWVLAHVTGIGPF
jgi:hypothetical protein